MFGLIFKRNNNLPYICLLFFAYSILFYKFADAEAGGVGGWLGVQTPLENQKWLLVSLELLVRVLLNKQMDPNTLMIKKNLSGPPLTDFF